MERLQLAARGIFVEPGTYREQLLLAAIQHENYTRFLETKAITAAILAAAPGNKNANEASGAYMDAIKALGAALLPPTVAAEEQEARDLAAAMGMLGKKFTVIKPKTEQKLPRQERIRLK